jgi:hypothetical protein
VIERRLLRAAWLVLALLGVPAGRARAQEVRREAPTITVRVRQVAGSSVYLDVGTRHGLARGDTLDVGRAGSTGPTGPTGPIGRLTVTASTETRSVLSFAGTPFPVTRGASLTIRLLREPAEAVPEPAAAGAAPRVGAPPARSDPAPATATSGASRGATAPVGPRPHGRIGLDVTAARTTTRVGTVDPTDVDRTFATPSFRFDATVPRALAGFQLRTSVRLAYRYSSEDLIRPAASTRVYAATLERVFTAVPMRVALGRFHSPVESYSGFWDGALLRVGRDVGVGTIVGFEPDRWNERPSFTSPKATVFVDASARGSGWRWAGDLSAHALRPTDSLPEHTFFGASQRVSVGPLRVGHDLQLDREEGGGWRVSRVRVNGSLEVGAGFQVRGGFARRETWISGLTEAFFAPRGERVDAGLSLRGPAGFISVDGSRVSDRSGRHSRGITGSFSLDQLPGMPVAGLWGSVARWTGPYGSTITAAPSLSFRVRPAWLRTGYRYSRSDYLDRLNETHAVEGSLDVPFSSGLRATGRMRLEWGGTLNGQSFDLGLYRIF